MSQLSVPAAVPTTPRLRTALRADAVVSGANGAAYVVAAGPLGDLLGLSPALLRGAGAVLLAFACVVWLAATRPRVPRRAVWAIVAVNAVWSVDSLAAVAAGWGSPEPLGAAWIVVQALVVAAFAALQATAARR